MEILIENVRSFVGSHEIPIKPLTLLVGENSSGKTSFLAMLARVTDYSFLAFRPLFNVPPFDLGNYDSIASRRGKPSQTFSIGLRGTGPKETHTIVATYRNRSGQPDLSKIRISDSRGELSILISKEGVDAIFKLEGADQPSRFRLPAPTPSSLAQPIYGTPISLVLNLLTNVIFRVRDREEGAPSELFRRAQDLRNWLFEDEGLASISVRQSYALAPVRTSPRRTYDEVSDVYRATGDHVPLILAQVMEGGSEPEKEHLIAALKEFGEDSGLFERIKPKRLGSHPGDPFQIMVAVAGPPANLADVGYGVSQSLPVIVQSDLLSEGGRLLLQQPEVHLHPRAQAALGTLFANLVASGNKEFVVETHSDSLVNRVRLEVARKRLSPDAVSILFFAKRQGRTKIHPISLDEHGNIVGAPRSYRQFFIDEEMKLLSRAKE